MSKRSVTACLCAMTCASVSLAQSITVVEPRTGNFEYIGQGNAGDSAIVYLTFSGLQIGGRNETAGFDITYADAAGNPVGGIVNIADLVADDQFGLCQQVPGGGDGDNNIESGETWSVNIAGALGGAIPLGASLISITFDPAGTPASTVANADGTSAGGTDAIDGRLQIITTRTAPAAAVYEGTGANSRMLVTYATPSVGFVSPNTASIPLFGSQDIGALGTTVSANSAQVGGGAGTDFEFTDANNFNSANGLAGTADITAGSFALPAGTTNVLQWQFDDTGSRLKEGVAFRVDISTTTVRDSAGNTVTFGSISTIDPRLPPLGVLPSPYTAARALDVSDDGQTVVGYLVGASRRAGFRWTPTDGYQVLPDLPGGPIDGIANTVSPSGALVGGFGTDSFASKAAIWTAGGTGQLALQLSLTGQLDRSEVLDISASDERAVGYHSSEYGTFACSWQLTDEPFATLRTLASIGGFPNIISAATGVDAMGTLAVGVYGSHAAIFPIGSFDATTKSADLAGGLSESTPLTLSRDGATFAGYSGALLGYEAYLYNDAIGVRSLGELPGGAHQSFAMAMNGSGTIIVGASETADGIEAFVWTNKIGMHRLKDLLLDRGVFSASSWTLEEATSITPDGLTIVGAGLDPQGRERPWIVRLDAPFDTCPGDFNLDSVTDASDFVLLASGFGMTQGATRLQGDADGDGDVDASDFVVLAGDFGCSQ